MMTPDTTMAPEVQQSEKTFEVTKADALRLLGKSEKTLQRWVKEQLIEVDYRKGPYGDEAFYNREDLLRMRHGKPRHDSDDAPLKGADLAVIARQSEQTNHQLMMVLQNLPEQMSVISQQLEALVKAKDETIAVTKEHAKLQKQLGGLEAKVETLEVERDTLKGEVAALKAPKPRKRFLGLFFWTLAGALGLAAVATVVGLAMQ